MEDTLSHAGFPARQGQRIRKIRDPPNKGPPNKRIPTNGPPTQWPTGPGQPGRAKRPRAKDNSAKGNNMDKKWLMCPGSSPSPFYTPLIIDR